jgi:hypothetical protein
MLLSPKSIVIPGFKESFQFLAIAITPSYQILFQLKSIVIPGFKESSQFLAIVIAPSGQMLFPPK